jgi:hypothetical protein
MDNSVKSPDFKFLLIPAKQESGIFSRFRTPALTGATGF